LPPLPDSTSSEDDSSEYSDEDDEEDETSTSYGLLDHVNGNNSNSITDERKSSVSEVENIREDSRRASEASLEHRRVSGESESNSPIHK